MFWRHSRPPEHSCPSSCPTRHLRSWNGALFQEALQMLRSGCAPELGNEAISCYRCRVKAVGQLGQTQCPSSSRPWLIRGAQEGGR